MVVLVILGLAAAAVATTLPERRPALDDAERLGMHLRRAREEALLGTRMVELVADASATASSATAATDGTAARSRPRATAVEQGVRLELPAGGRRASVRFDALGGAQPQALTLADANGRFRVTVDAAGRVELHGAPR